MDSQNNAAGMGDTSIRVSEELADELYQRKGRSTTYEELLWELLEIADRADEGVDSDDIADSDSSRGASTAPVTEGAPDGAANGEQGLAGLSFPSGVGHAEGVEAIHAARDYLRERGSASMREIVLEVMPDYSLKYDPPETLESGERYRGAWWRNVVKPGLEALDDVEKPGAGSREWTYVGGDDE